jgi:hypothetical protein
MMMMTTMIKNKIKNEKKILSEKIAVRVVSLVSMAQLCQYSVSDERLVLSRLVGDKKRMESETFACMLAFYSRHYPHAEIQISNGSCSFLQK